MTDEGLDQGLDRVLDEHPFALCLTHDVDRPYKTYQAAYYAAVDRDPAQLASLRPGRNPYWQFESIMALERDLGVRSAFYFLQERRLFHDEPVRSWLRPSQWQLYVGRYRLSDPAIVSVIHQLREGGWEIGLHGSYGSYLDRERLAWEKSTLESVLGSPVIGGRQHYLNLELPTTWRHHASVGLRYDASLGTGTGYGFQFGYRPLRPFEDGFVVFPLTLMEHRLPDVEDDPVRAWQECEGLLAEAESNAAVMTVLWHPRYFAEAEFPRYSTLYERLVEAALDRGAWVGPPGELYRLIEPSPGSEASDVAPGLATR